MQVTFEYNLERDVWCLLNKGKSSNNSQLPTRAYTYLIAEYGENPTPEQAAVFVSKYAQEKDVDPHERVERFQRDWNAIAAEYRKRAEEIFSIALPHDVTGYLTVNSRCPYSISGNFFFVSVLAASPARATAMHELWHFYTWYGLGAGQEEKLGKARYNELKEAFTVLLNVECADLMPEGIADEGYPQHRELRERILRLWAKDKNIRDVWEQLSGIH